MKTVAIIIPALCVVLAAGAAEVDGIVAMVGGESILRSDVLGEMRRPGAEGLTFEAVRNSLIDRRLILRAAATSKMTMQEWVVDNRVREIVESAFDGDRNKLKATLAQQKMQYEEWRRRIKENLIIDAMRWHMVDKNISVSPSDIKREFDNHPERYSTDAKVTVAVILLKPEDIEKRGEIDTLLKEKDFGDVARQYSVDSHAADGGCWREVRPEDEFLPEICNAISDLKVGDTSAWIEQNGWSFLIKKLGITDAQPGTIAKCYAQIEANVRREKSKKLYDEWMNLLKEETFIQVR